MKSILRLIEDLVREELCCSMEVHETDGDVTASLKETNGSILLDRNGEYYLVATGSSVSEAVEALNELCSRGEERE